MFTKLKELYDFVDQTVATIYTKHPKEICCRPGCDDCCHATFDISFIEAAYLALYLRDNPEVLNRQQDQAQNAAVAFEKMVKTDGDPSTTRIRCPLLSEDKLCLAHSSRPINCRTYGTPTVIESHTHVCGISKFDSEKSYATIDLAPLQKSLNEYSIELVGDDFGNRRFPIAWVFLRIDFFLPRA